jgi:phosphohistidine phosphatase
MKTLYLVRHAKSDWSDASLDDFDRPLNKRGRNNAPLMGRVLREKGVNPDLIVSSPALRAITTAQVLAREIGYAQEKIVTNQQIYEASVKTLTKVISKQSASKETLMLVGHNPGLTAFANHVSDFNADNVPTTGVVCIQFAMDDWKNLESTTGKLVFFHYPKEFT